MTGFLELLAVFAAIYLFDCVHWARRETVAFRTWWRARTRIVAGEDMPGNQRYGLVFAQPVLPFGRLFLTQTFPLSLSRDVACSFVAHATNPGPRAPQVERVVRLERGLRVETETRRVLVQGELFVEAGSERLARRLAALVAELAALDPKRRDARIDQHLKASLDTRACAGRVEEFGRATRLLRIACTAELAVVFALTPVLGLQFGLAHVWIWPACALVASQALVAWSFVRAHRALFPEASPERPQSADRSSFRGEAITLALSPPAAMRAVDALSRDLLAEFHPLAAAHALVARDEFEALVESTLRDALHPLPIRRDGDDPDVRAADVAWRRRLLAALEDFATREGIDAARWRHAPVRLDPDCLSYCPRCAQQFTVTSGTCSRCWDLPLESLGAAP